MPITGTQNMERFSLLFTGDISAKREIKRKKLD
jgi:hypothetical protein